VAKALATLGTGTDTGAGAGAGTDTSTGTDAAAGRGDGPARPRAGADVLLTALDPLTGDPDALVRGAAFEALAATGCPAPYAARAVAAQADAAWQVRAGAATALGAAEPDTAVPALAKALADPNADVRKAAVLGLLRHARRGVPGAPGVPEAVAAARAALATAVTDTDADVRAYAARAGSA
jgi:HEAT repeat protein